MNKDWILLGVAILSPVLTLLAGFFAGHRGRSNAIATTVEKDWLHTVAEDLAEFIELQIDIVWKRWRIKVIQGTTPETSSQSYQDEAFRILQEASWSRTFRSDLLKTKLILMLDDQDGLQEELIKTIDEYAKHAPNLVEDLKNLEKNVPEKKLEDLCYRYDGLLREKRPLILAAGRHVLAAKRAAIRKSI
ncbi:MAG: hypothetical protein ACXWID_18310 [Pyrinomonadaceae bacterium]